MSLKVLILGVNGFIGNSLVEHIIRDTDWEVYGMDMSCDKLDNLGHERLHFIEGDININKEWIEYHIRKCDVVLPLVAIATPATYVQEPLRVFELDFEANLKIIRQCAQYNTRVIFPSTSEVYGMSNVDEFVEGQTELTLGPINKERWIYSCSKQLLDRVIYAYGKHHGLSFSIFRPFNFIGAKQDNIHLLKEGGSRVVTQFLTNIIYKRDLQLVDGGTQQRCFTDIDDGVACLMKIIENKDGCADGQIFNIGNPKNNHSIKELAEFLVELAAGYKGFENIRNEIKIVETSSDKYYGDGYQDVKSRVPSVAHAKAKLGWEPKLDLQASLRKVLDFHLNNPDFKLD